MKLHTKLGKPIPEIPSAEVQEKEKKKDETKEQTPKNFRNQQRKRKPTTPKITFLGGSQLNVSGESTPTQGDSANTAGATTPSTPTTPGDGDKKEGGETKKPELVG